MRSCVRDQFKLTPCRAIAHLLDMNHMMNVESIAAGTDPADEVDTSGVEDGPQGVVDTGTSLLVIPEQFIGKIL